MAYSEFKYIQNPGILKPEVYSEPSYIENSGTFRNRDTCKIQGYSEHWDIQNWRHTQNFVKHLWQSFSYISFSCPQVHEINMIFLMQV